MATSDLGVVKPISKGTHDKTKTYEVLNIVESNSKTYMANKDVPANTLITSAEFWLDLSGDVMTTQELSSIAMTKPTVTNKLITETEAALVDAKIIKNTAGVAANVTQLARKIETTTYAKLNKGGTIKLRVTGTDCFISTNGADA